MKVNKYNFNETKINNEISLIIGRKDFNNLANQTDSFLKVQKITKQDLEEFKKLI